VRRIRVIARRSSASGVLADVVHCTESKAWRAPRTGVVTHQPEANVYAMTFGPGGMVSSPARCEQRVNDDPQRCFSVRSHAHTDDAEGVLAATSAG
jgi:hypothetical protein